MPDNLWGTMWKLEGLVQANGSWEPDETGKEIRIEFLDSAGLEIQLPVNECGADVLVLTEKQIKLGPPVCTQVCCDPEYAQDFMDVLSQVRSYYIKDKKLYLQGPQGSAIFIE